MIDTHAHITSEFFDDIESLINELKSKNILKVINCADSIKSSKEIIKLGNKFNNFLLPAIGIHPENIDDANVKEIEELLLNNKIYAIGEIGLDYHYNKENKKLQKEIFEAQLILSEKYKLPVIVHTRESIQDCYDILSNHNCKGIIHCFSGSYEMAKQFIDLGFLLGIGGVLTFKNSKLYEVIEKIDLKNMVLETDSPFLSPEPHRGEKNIPSNVYFVAKKIAEIKKMSIDEVINITTSNAINLFDI